jgi:hypothetical protein
MKFQDRLNVYLNGNGEKGILPDSDDGGLAIPADYAGGAGIG